MNELVVIVEGETEQAFVSRQLAEHLALHGTSMWPVLSGKNRNRSGVQKWKVARQDMVRTLKEGRYCTTMTDYYAMPDDWPGRAYAKSMAWSERASHVENKLKGDIARVMGKRFHPRYFIPYVQLHEFEALAFADVGQMISVLVTLSDQSAKFLEAHFKRILDEAGHPEAIDDGRETCPSRRITGVVPAYKKRVHGPIITGRIGLEAIRERCDHFASWLERLERLGS